MSTNYLKVMLMKLKKKGVSFLWGTVVAAVIALLLILLYPMILGKFTIPFIGSADIMIDDSAVNLCITQNPGTDTDGDGIPDVCDPCVLITTPEARNDLLRVINLPEANRLVKWTANDIHSYNPGYKRGQEVTLEDSIRYDKDSDKIVGICDSDPDKKAKKARTAADIVESECIKVREKFEALNEQGLLTGRFSVTVRSSTTGQYNTCIITYRLSN
jgi:hypothetical protein